MEDLKDRLQQLCDCLEEVKKYKNEATEFICKKYNWDAITEETLELYR